MSCRPRSRKIAMSFLAPLLMVTFAGGTTLAAAPYSTHFATESNGLLFLRGNDGWGFSAVPKTE